MTRSLPVMVSLAVAFTAVFMLVLGPLASGAHARKQSGKEAHSPASDTKKSNTSSKKASPARKPVPYSSTRLTPVNTPKAKQAEPGQGKKPKAVSQAKHRSGSGSHKALKAGAATAVSAPSAGRKAVRPARDGEEKSRAVVKASRDKASRDGKGRLASAVRADKPGRDAKPVRQAATAGKAAPDKREGAGALKTARSAKAKPDRQAALRTAKAKRSTQAVRPARPLVVIDPGHGGHDPGAMAGGLVEKHVTLKVAKLLRKELTRKGFDVRLTRTTDKALTPARRLRMATRLKPALFVSLHCNWSASRSQKGIETFAYLPKRLHSGRGSVVPIEEAPSETASIRHAGGLHQELVQVLGPRGVADNGARLGRFAVLEPRPWPSLLIEMGYLSNRYDAKRLSSAAFQSWFAARLADAVAERFAPGGSMLAGRKAAPRS